MKKIWLMGLVLIGCASCRSDYGTLSEIWKSGASADEQAVYQETAVEPASQTGTVSIPRTAQPRYMNDADRFRQNIVMKVSGEDYVVYEYADVRIDDVATLASRYCFETTQGKKAYLRDIYMTKNHKRRATFDCVHLASQ